jgi:hypothetical protein
MEWDFVYFAYRATALNRDSLITILWVEWLIRFQNGFFGAYLFYLLSNFLYGGDDIVLFTDKNTAYVDISDIVDTHYVVISDKVSVNETLKWVHKESVTLKRSF